MAYRQASENIVFRCMCKEFYFNVVKILFSCNAHIMLVFIYKQRTVNLKEVNFNMFLSLGVTNGLSVKGLHCRSFRYKLYDKSRFTFIPLFSKYYHFISQEIPNDDTLL